MSRVKVSPASSNNGGFTMFRKLFLVPAVLSLVVLGIAAETAQAQRFTRRERREERREMRRGYVPAVAGPVVYDDVAVYDAGPRTSYYLAPGTAPGVADAASIR